MTPNEMAREIRRLIIEISYKANVGHIGSNLSIVSIVAALYAPNGGVLKWNNPEAVVLPPGRDRFVLSKGHAVLALYCALHLRGFIAREELDTYCQPGSRLYTHPNHEVPGVEYSTGSLGMGLSYACGEALAAKMQGSLRKVYCLVSDGELGEGSLWEAVMFAAHHKLDNLVCIVDANGQQALGKTKDIVNMDDGHQQSHLNCGITDKFRSFGWTAGVYYPGKDRFGAIVPVSPKHLRGEYVPKSNIRHENAPLVIVCYTTFGDGVSFMEIGGVAWHYSPMNAEQYAQALAEVTA